MKTFPTKTIKPTFHFKSRNYLREYGRLSTMHGVYYLTETRSRCEKFFWITIMSLSLSVCVYIILEMWEKYQTSPIVVSFAPKESTLFDIPFPGVTICPEAKCAKSKFNYSGVRHNFLNGNNVTVDDYGALHYLHSLCEKKDDGVPTLILDDFFDVIDGVRPNLKINCSFLGINFDCEDVFFRVVTDQGICYTFNTLHHNEIYRDNIVNLNRSYQKFSNDSRFFDGESGYLKDVPVGAYPFRGFISGANNALEVYFSTNVSDSGCKCNTYFQGYRVVIHSPLEIPRLARSYFPVSYDTSVMVSVQPHLVTTTEKVQKFNPEIRRCYLKHERPLKYFRLYSQKNCFLECLTNMTLRKCGCVRFFMPRENKTKICSGNLTECLDATERMIRKNIINFNQNLCDCKPSCNLLSYDAETSQGNFYWEGYVEKKEKNFVTHDEIRYSFLSVYLKNDHFMTIERKQLYGIGDFVSNFGGLLSLFTGFSIISLFEIIYFLSLRIICNRRLYKNWAGSMC